MNLSSSKPQFSNLLAPGRIGSMELKNRMVMSPMTTAYCLADQTPSERLIAHFEARAKGGVGLVTVELVTVASDHPYMHRSMTLGEDSYVDKHRPLVDAIHAHGAKVQPQISHTGPESVAPLFGGPQPVGPSVNIAPVWGWHSRELSEDELPAIYEQYGEAARRAREAGYDGIELHAAHCYNLLASFLSPLRNKRNDDYSAFKLESRIRIFQEVLASIKSRAGHDFPITLSISGYERAPGGRGLDDTQALAPLLVDAGVDCFRVSGGVSDALVTQMVSRSEAGSAMNAANAEAIRNVVDVPVMVVGRLHDPIEAEAVLANGQADLVAMARPLLADPELPNKVASGRYQQIRACISCENCIDSMQSNDNLACAVNPISGREMELAVLNNTESPARKVLIVGGGPGGMEAARLASEAGHTVTLLEQQKRLGGSLLLAATVHSDNEAFLRFLKAEMQRLDIDVRLNVTATPQFAQEMGADVVIVATGAKVETPDILGVQAPHVISGSLMRQCVTGNLQGDEAQRLAPWLRKAVSFLMPIVGAYLSPALLREGSKLFMPIGKRVVIIGADLAATELAEFIARRGRRVHLLETKNKICPEVGKKRRAEHMDRLDGLNITVNTRIEIVEIKQSSVEIRSANQTLRSIPADTIIVAGEVVADLTVAQEFEAAGFEVKKVGDCTGLGLIAKATHTAAEAVASLAKP